MIKSVVTKQEIAETNSFKNLNPTLKLRFLLPLYIKGFSNWLTVALNLGLDHALSLPHMTDNKKAILTDIYFFRVKQK